MTLEDYLIERMDDTKYMDFCRSILAIYSDGRRRREVGQERR